MPLGLCVGINRMQFLSPHGAHTDGGTSEFYPDATEALAAGRASGETTDPRPNKRSHHTAIARWLSPNPKTLLLAICWAFLLIWCAWWCMSVHRQVLQGGESLWFQPPLFGGDFYYHIDRASRVWWNGGDPYGDRDYEHMYFYPPIVPRLFGWVNCMSPRAALTVWLTALVAILVTATWAAVAVRRRLGLTNIHPIVAVVLVFFSTPVLFAMERGQCDPLSLLFIVGALPLLKSPSKWAQYAAGALLCLAPWLKVYPGLLAVGLLGLRRWRAFAGFAVAGIALALLDYHAMRGFLTNQRFLAHYMEDMARLSASACPWNHPLATVLAGPLLGTRFQGLAMPLGRAAAAAVLLPLLSWVTYHVYRCPKRDALSYPFFLWTVALATFVPAASNDYNLCFLPLAAVAVWDRRDPMLVHVAMALLFLWWQPIAISIPGNAVLLFKLLGLMALGVCLVERACEQTHGTTRLTRERAVPRGPLSAKIQGKTWRLLTP